MYNKSSISFINVRTGVIPLISENNVLDTTTPYADLNIAASQLSGDIKIGNAKTSGSIYLGNTGNTGNSVIINAPLKCGSLYVGTNITAPIIDATTYSTNMTIGSNLTNGSLDIGGVQTGNISLGAGQTQGVLNIGTGYRTTGGNGGGINIGTSAISDIPIIIGTTGQSTTSLRGNVNVVTNLSSPSLDSTSATTLQTVGSNLSTANLTIAGSQTQGVLNIGTGYRTTGGNGGGINIGTGSVTAPINIGGGESSSGSINIGQNETVTGTSTVNINTSTVGSHPVNIGSTSALTTVNGALNVNGILTTNGGITCPTILPTLGKTNLLYTYTFASVSNNSSAIGTTYVYSPASNIAGAGNYLNAGIYAVFVNSMVYELAGPTTGSCTYTLGVCYGSTPGTIANNAQYGTVTSVTKQSMYQRIGQNNVRVGNALAGTFTLTSANFVNIQISNNITIAFTSGSVWSVVDGLIIRIG